MGVYTEAFYHFVWATRRREWFITDAVERDLHRFIHGKCDVLRVHIYALNGMPDHVHLVVGLPATLSVSDFMEAVKGTSGIISIICQTSPVASTGSPATDY